MKLLTIPLLGLALAMPAAAIAKPGNGNGNGNGHGAAKHMAKTVPGQTAACPPGLAKKDPACVPPGLAKNATRDRVVEVGDVLDGAYFGERYILVRDPERYALDPYGTYYRIGGDVFQVDRETREVVALIGAVTDILN
ncbi:hypothetical protein [Pseudooceanicola sp. MF1-13]|uniref:hypothetical protein n=1 Tax=Pseudooceanicola sp. MF1-13 TaxID=3379095 RepID=UPI003891DB8A